MAMSNAKEKSDIDNILSVGSTCVPVRPWELGDMNPRDRRPDSPNAFRIGSNGGGKSINLVKGVSTATAEGLKDCDITPSTEHGEGGLQKFPDEDPCRETLFNTIRPLPNSLCDSQHETNTDCMRSTGTISFFNRDPSIFHIHLIHSLFSTLSDTRNVFHITFHILQWHPHRMQTQIIHTCVTYQCLI